MRKRLVILCSIMLLLLVAFVFSQKDLLRMLNPGRLLRQQRLLKEITGKDGAPMVLIPAGEFQMGTDKAEIPGLVQLTRKYFPQAKAEWFEDETPRHTVYLDAFYMDKYEVTNAQYKKFVQATGYKKPEGFGIVKDKILGDFKPWSDPNYNGDNQPVLCVSWDDAKAYCEWAGKRLPTEAEWEKAARGGLVGKRYVWGDEWTPPEKAGNFADESAKKVFPGWGMVSGYDDGYTYPAPVGSFTPNGYGLCDMAGNVWEWCADWHDSGYYSKSPKSNPIGPDSGSYRVLRGGSWRSDTNILRVGYRLSLDPSLTLDYVGFRCAGLK